MNKWNTLLNEVKTEVNRLQIENKHLAKRCFSLLSKNIILEGEVKRLKELNYSVMKINYLLSENIKS